MKNTLPSVMSCSSTTMERKTSSKVAWLLVALIALSSHVSAQYSGTLTVPSTPFPTLKACVDSLNLSGVSGPVTVNVTAAQTIAGTGNTGTIVLGSAVLNNSIVAAAGRSITFNGNGNTITGQTGGFASTTVPTFTSNILWDEMWAVLGTDNVTINNFIFVDPAANTTTTTSIEVAIGLHNRTAIAGNADGCQNVTISNCTFNFKDIASNAHAIQASCHPFTPAVAPATIFWNAFNDKHRNINIVNNTFNDCFAALRTAGPNSQFAMSGLKFNNNTVNKLGGGNISLTCYGLNMFYTDSIEVMNNTFSTDTGILNTGFYSVVYPQYTAGSQRYESNTFNMSMRNNGSTTNAMQNFTYSWMPDPAPASFVLRKNTVNFTGSSPVLSNNSNTNFSNFTGFQLGGYVNNTNNNQYQNFKFRIDSNIMENIVFPGIGTLNFIIVNNGNINTTTNTAASLDINDNIFRNVTRNGGGGSTVVIQKSISGGYLVSRFLRNIIANVTYSPTHTGVTTATFTGIANAGITTPTYVVDSVFDNTIENINMVRNIQTTNTFTGITHTSSPRAEIFGNTVRRAILGSTAGNSQTNNITGIQLSNATGSAINAYRNRIDSLQGNGNFGLIAGVQFSSTGTSSIFNN